MFLVQTLRRLRRDRRRIGMALILLFAAGATEAWNMPSSLPRGGFEVLAGLAVMSLGGCLLLGFGLLLPGLRHYYVPISLTFFGAAALGHLLPGSAFSLTSISEGGARALFGLSVTAISVHLLFYARWSDKVLRLPRSRQSAETTSSLDQSTLWHGLVATPGRREAMMDPEVLSVDWFDRDRTRVRIIRWSPPKPKREEHLKIEELVPGEYILYSFLRELGTDGRIDKGMRSVRILDEGDSRIVRVTEYRRRRALRQVVQDWIDDTLGRGLDADVAYLEACVARTGAKADQRRDQLAIGGVLRPQSRDRRRGASAGSGRRGDFSIGMSLPGPKLAAGK